MKKPFLHYTMIAAEGRPAEEIKYREIADLLLTLEICARIHQKDRPMKRVRQAALNILPRLTDSKAQSICRNVANPIIAPDPIAFVTACRRASQEADQQIRRMMIRDGVIGIGD